MADSLTAKDIARIWKRLQEECTNNLHQQGERIAQQVEAQAQEVYRLEVALSHMDLQEHTRAILAGLLGRQEETQASLAQTFAAIKDLLDRGTGH